MTDEDATKSQLIEALAALQTQLAEAEAARQLAEAARRESEAQFRGLAENSPELIVRHALDGCLHYVSPACRALLGYEAETLLGRRLYDFVHPDEQAAMIEAHRSLVTSGHAVTLRCRLRGQAGAYLWFETRSQTLGQATGELAEIQSIAHDISARSRLEQELADAKALLEAAVEQTPIPMILASAPDAVIRIMNSASQEFLGIEDEEPYVGRPLLGLQQTWQDYDAEGNPVPAAELPLALAFKEIIVKNREYRVVRKDGLERWELMNATPIYNARGELIAGFVAFPDITERKWAEFLRQIYAARLERSNRDLQDFASSASHDLQEPLRKIRMFGERLTTRANTGLTAEARDWIARMINAAARMQAMIDALLDYSRVTTKAQPFAQVDLAQVAAEAVADLEASLEQTGGRVELGELPRLEADALQMRLLLQNLIGNALKFHRPGVPPVVKVWGQALSSSQVQIRVADNGIGVDVPDLPRLFRPFERLNGRSEYEGSGMGLAICRKIVERHEGTITAQRAPEGGAVFSITLPYWQPKGPAAL